MMKLSTFRNGLGSPALPQACRFTFCSICEQSKSVVLAQLLLQFDEDKSGKERLLSASRNSRNIALSPIALAVRLVSAALPGFSHLAFHKLEITGRWAVQLSHRGIQLQQIAGDVFSF
jgi:hypothetical protein